MRNTQNKKELIMRYVLLIVSLFISGIGIAVTKRGELGVPPHFFCGKYCQYPFSGVEFWNMAVSMELSDDCGTDRSAEKGLSMDSAVTDPLVGIVWMVYRFWSVDCWICA